MSIIATYTQQPADRLDYDVYYASAPDGTPDFIDTGDSLASVVTSVTPTGLTVTSLLTDNRVKLWVSDGVDGVTYKVTITATTTLGRVKQDELRFKLREV